MHVIKYANDEQRFIKINPYKSFYLGTKDIEYENGLFKSTFMPYTYSYRLLDDKIVFYEKNRRRFNQKVLTYILCEVNKQKKSIIHELKNTIIAGFHISPIRDDANHAHSYLVMFEIKDILFYDGSTISVNHFSLVGTKFIKQHNARFFEIYPELLPLAERSDEVIMEVAKSYVS